MWLTHHFDHSHSLWIIPEQKWPSRRIEWDFQSEVRASSPGMGVVRRSLLVFKSMLCSNEKVKVKTLQIQICPTCGAKVLATSCHQECADQSVDQSVLLGQKMAFAHFFFTSWPMKLMLSDVHSSLFMHFMFKTRAEKVQELDRLRQVWVLNLISARTSNRMNATPGPRDRSSETYSWNELNMLKWSEMAVLKNGLNFWNMSDSENCVCVCVGWTVWTNDKFLFCMVYTSLGPCWNPIDLRNSRGPGTHDCLSWQTKTRQHGGENVPADSDFLSWAVANPRTTLPTSTIWAFSCTVVAICLELQLQLHSNWAWCSKGFRIFGWSRHYGDYTLQLFFGPTSSSSLFFNGISTTTSSWSLLYSQTCFVIFDWDSIPFGSLYWSISNLVCVCVSCHVTCTLNLISAISALSSIDERPCAIWSLSILESILEVSGFALWLVCTCTKVRPKPCGLMPYEYM